jgi:hypothetical protein
VIWELGLTCADDTSNTDKQKRQKLFACVGGEVGIPDHRNMAIFQLADKFTFTMTFTADTSRLAVWFGFLLIFHAQASRRLVSEEEGR